ADARGNHVLVGLTSIRHVIAPIIGKSGPLMSQWQQGLDKYYAEPPQFAPAASDFGALASSSTYKDFGGVAPYLTAANPQSPPIPALTTPREQQGSGGGGSGGGGSGGVRRQAHLVLPGPATGGLGVLIISSLPL